MAGFNLRRSAAHAVALASACLALTGADALAREAPSTSASARADFADQSATLAKIDRASRVRAAGTVIFDERAAVRAGLDPAARKLGRELVAFSNAVVRASRAQGLEGATSALRKAPAVARYFKLASTTMRGGGAKAIPGGAANPVARASYGDNWWTYTTCGWYWTPRPTVGKWPVTFYTNNPAGTLYSWGYHPTPGWAGGGWTRDQTHAPWHCGWRTFRDHAYIPAWNQIREQNYHGWNPRGEPNPELWRVGPWPYSTWPAYVYWWHRYH